MHEKQNIRYAKFLSPDRIEHWGIVKDGNYLVKLNNTPFDDPQRSKDEFAIDEVTLLAPCSPTKIVAIGLNYKDHAEELKMAIPDEPIIFLKPPTSLAASSQVITMPKASKQVDYEAELAIIIGKTANNIEEEDSDGHILGYTCANDVTARDLQKKDGQWSRAKGFDGFCPTGPFLNTLKPSRDAKIVLRKNRVKKQESILGQMIFPIETIVSFVSKVMTLMPGDLILTGTPPGVGPISPGDEIEIDIEGLGILRNKFALENIDGQTHRDD